MSAKYYCVSEEELNQLMSFMYDLGVSGGMYTTRENIEKAKASCKSRPMDFPSTEKLSSAKRTNSGSGKIP